MLETTNSKFSIYKLREKIVEMLGGSPIQYRYLLNTEKLVEKRALRGNRGTTLSLALSCLILFVMSSVIPVMLILNVDVFTYTLLGITVSMMTIGFWMLPYFDILLSPTNYPVVAHTPVSSRTYFLVKLTQVLTYTSLLLISSNLLPAIGGIWLREEDTSGFLFLFPVIYLLVAFMSGFFTIGVMTTFAGYLAKFYTKKGLRNIAQYAQFIFPTLFPMLWIFLPRLLSRSLPEDVTVDELSAVLKWFYALPNGWFTGIVLLALGQIERHFLILTGLAVASTLFLVFIPLRIIAKSYSEYLSYLLESGNRQKSELRVKTSLFARLFQNPTMRAGFCLSAAYLCRDRHILRQLLASVGGILVIVVVFAQDELFSLKWIRDSHFIGLSPGFSGMFCFFGMGFVDSFVGPVRYSEHWKASWMLTLAPLTAPRDLWRGVQVTALIYFVVPCTLLMFCVATVFWGIYGIFYVLPVSIVLLYHVLLYPKPPSGMPLSAEFVQKRMAAGGWFPLLRSLLIIWVFIGIQFLAYLLSVWVYFGVYCVMVVGGFIGFIYCFRKSDEMRKNVSN